MSFVHLAALWGLTLLAVPLLLLLLRRRKLVLYWAAYEWIQATIVRRRREIEIRDLLKLIAKLLLLTAIVILVARPYLRANTSRGPLLLVIDVSPSMGARLDDGTRLDRAKRLALELVERHDGPLCVYSFAATLEPVVGDYTRDKGELRDRIGRIALRSGAAGVATLAENIQSGTPWGRASRVVMLGDFQSAWYGDGQEVERQVSRLGRAHPMSWVQVDERPDVENLMVTKMSLSADGVWPGRPAFCDIEIANGLSRDSAPHMLSIVVDGEEMARQAVRLGPQERRIVTLAPVFRTSGLHNVEVRLDEDALVFDNVRYGVVDVPRKLRVVAVVGSQGAAPFPWDTYVRRALASALPGEAMDYRAVSPLEFATISLDAVDLVVGVNASFAAAGPAAARLQPFLERGGGALLFLAGERPDEASALGLSASVVATRQGVDATKLEGTILSFMRDPGLKAEAIGLTQSLVFSNALPAEVRLRTTAGPVVARVTRGRGAALVFGFTPYPGRGDFQFNPNFVQAMLRSVWEVRNWDGLHSDNGATRELRLPDLTPESAYSLVAAQSGTYHLALDGVGEAARLLLPAEFPPGIYQVLENGRERARFGHNADTADSQLDAVDDQTLAPAVRQGLAFGGERVLRQGSASRQLEALAVAFLLAALMLEIYAHFLRKSK
ncbi:MAG: VWA domain-containing protein [bacterium]